MLRDVDDLDDGAAIRCAVGIIGGGFAGLELARCLGRAGVEVVVLESGRLEFDPQIQELARVISVGKSLRTPSPDSPFTPYLAPVFRGETRLRQLGGTSNIWTGKWRPFDDLDFSRREWIPHSGWPISRADLAPYYRQVAEAYGLGDFEAFEDGEAVRQAREQVAEAGLELSFHYWAASAARPNQDHRDELRTAPTVEVITGANATELILADDLATVVAARFRSLDGRDFLLHADRFALAAGGLEVARLLLASDTQRPGGIGNEHDQVGRFHMDHPKHKGATLLPGPAIDTVQPWTTTQPRPTFHVSLSLADRVQREAQVLDHAVYLAPVYRYQVDYPETEVAALKDAVRTRQPRAAVAAVGRLLRSPRSMWKIAARTRHRDRGGAVAHYRASMYVEQAPNPESRLLLADERDAIGMRRLIVDWQLDALDRRSFTRVLTELAERLERAGIGTLDMGTDAPSLDDWVDAAHHIGSTRMASTPEEGVVDADCRVFGTANLYVASSAVFPTGHSAAPTMTILALARRLADHLIAGEPGPPVPTTPRSAH